MVLSAIKIVFIVVFTAIVSSMEIFVGQIDRSGRAFHALARFWARIVLFVAGVSVIVQGAERLERGRNYVYVSNHASMFDIPAMIAGVNDQLRLIYKKELEKIPFFGWGLRFGRVYIGIERAKGQDAMLSLDAAAEKIGKGSSVLLFAEGTRSPDGMLQQFKRGPFNLAVKAGVPVVPASIIGSYRVLPKNSYRIRPGQITIILDKPIDPPAANGRNSELELRDLTRAAIEHHLQRTA